MTNNADHDSERTKQQAPPSFAPPVILDRLLDTMKPQAPAELPPKIKALPPRENLPPKARIPPSIAAQREGAPPIVQAPLSSGENGTPSRHAPSTPKTPMPPVALPDFPVAASPRKRSPLMVGLMLVILLNLVLVVFIMLMFRERSAQQQVAPPQPPVTRVTEPPPSTAPPAPDTIFEKTPAEEDYLIVEPEPETPTPRMVEQPAAGDVLHIQKLVLCRSVSGFGHYEPIPNIPLRPNHYPHIQAYVEIAHPKPERRDDGRYVYRMTKTMKVYRSDIGPTEPVMDTALSLVMGGYSRRSDFHSAQALQTSRRIEPGEYVLVVGITDQISGETTTEEIAFLIHGL